mmetsp:Transcript_27680/g.33670  ORF Transcript_27680/g.33670 Transcript_27680/m.33670 type:complete len:293 (-) Transcript_27680:62-940(-)|eukprot:CAMPEP_0172479388 /NCGR_PEP_ID=MMETSP1066-20121228/3915_1 /TAXON_ID=671091 /ORGANISM="Coscinodiscus wailesii, Strain CCMP2513" /LENGTH=292 /DNA_ID=CAMNT_0013239807 /DNA_START=188 /DNA_END=1066 /DNA_ORIENTATION=+
MRNSSSRNIFNENERRVETEIQQLLCDIRRIGPTFPDPEPRVLYGELFDDEKVEQYYEALVGTLKSAKKRGVITFKGQMLLKGPHDRVLISIVGDDIPPLNDEMVETKTSSRGELRGDKLTTSAANGVSVKRPTLTRRLSEPVRRSVTKKNTSQFKPSSKPSTSKNSYSSHSSGSRTPYTISQPPKLVRSRTLPTASATVHKSRTLAPSAEQNMRVDTEVKQLLLDIRRIGIDGEPTVTFGELFDDENVQQYYEALVGTLKTAKRRGYISFKGQMLLKGIHDRVEISIVKDQ